MWKNAEAKTERFGCRIISEAQLLQALLLPMQVSFGLSKRIHRASDR